MSVPFAPTTTYKNQALHVVIPWRLPSQIRFPANEIVFNPCLGCLITSRRMDSARNRRLRHAVGFNFEPTAGLQVPSILIEPKEKSSNRTGISGRLNWSDPRLLIILLDFRKRKYRPSSRGIKQVTPANVPDVALAMFLKSLDHDWAGY